MENILTTVKEGINKYAHTRFEFRLGVAAGYLSLVSLPFIVWGGEVVAGICPSFLAMLSLALMIVGSRKNIVLH